jgi:hypothetical protein
MPETQEIPETRQRRCPRLGHPVPFAYCLKCGDSQDPCFKIADCWWELLDVVGYLNDHFPPETVSCLLTPTPPKPKVTSLMELIEQAKQRIEKNKEG